MERPVDISVVVPIYNGADLVKPLVDRLIPALASYGNYEVIFVDDGSSDETVEVLRKMVRSLSGRLQAGNREAGETGTVEIGRPGTWEAGETGKPGTGETHSSSSKQGPDAEFSPVSAFILAENVGQQEATRCGMCRARGELVVTMDDDLQHRPEDIPRLVAELEAGADLVFGVPSRDVGGGEPEDAEPENLETEGVPSGGKNTGWDTAARGGGGWRNGMHDFIRSCGSKVRDFLFRRVSAAGHDVFPTSFRACTRRLVDDLCRSRKPVPYLSVSLVRRSRRVSHVEVMRPEASHLSSRYPAGKLFSVFAGLLLSLPGTPSFPAGVFSGKRCRVVEEVRGRAKRVLVVGGGDGQLSGIRYAKNRGYVAGVSDANPHAPGARIADLFIEADTFDPEETAEAARRFGADGVLTYGTDQPVLTVAKTADRLGLPGVISPSTACAATNKRVMKRIFDDHDIPGCRYRILQAEAAEGGSGREANQEGGKMELSAAKELLEGLRPPLVLKPVDSQGQRGVLRVDGYEEALRRLPETLAYSREGSAVVEEYYEAGEVTFSGWVVEGRLYPLTITDRVTVQHPPHIGVCISHNYPSRYYRRYGDEILRVSRRIVEAFGIEEGPVYFQMLIGGDGVKVNEIACRIGGAYEDEFIPMLTGVDILGLAFDEALYGTPRDEAMGRLDDFCYPAEGNLSVLLFFTGPLTVASTASVERLLRLPGVQAARYLLSPGREIGPMKNSTGRAGYVIVTGGDSREINTRIHGVYSELAVYDAEGENHLIDYAGASMHIEST